MSGPDAGAVLRARIKHKLAELDAAEDWLEFLAKRDTEGAALGQPATSALSATVRNRYRTSLEDRRSELRDQEAKVDRLSAGAAWSSFEKAADDADRVRGEMLALVQGSLFRAEQLDANLCAVADHLLAGLSRRSNLEHRVLTTVSAEGESVNHTLALVRLQVPGTTAWHLPIVVHEFGHHVARELPPAPLERGTERPALARIADELPTEQRVAGTEPAVASAHLHELFADAYATYALGPAYPLTCILLRVPATTADRPTRTHPSWTRRVHLMLASLEEMTRVSKRPRYRAGARNVVRPVWERIVPGAALDEALRAHTSHLARQFVGLLARATRDLRYEGGDVVNRVAALVGNDAGAPPLPPDTAVSTVLNAAWRWRLDRWEEIRDAELAARSDRILTYCLAAVG